jgi:BirA family transcriptional regulator, biotin operon repressor / biotin---[acetyl-CoA-carboxylase] ligase
VSKINFDKELFSYHLDGPDCAGNRQVAVYNEIDSTSRELSRLLRDGNAPTGTVIVAESQLAGKGRLGRTWHSPKEGNLYISVVVEVHGPVSEVVPLVPLAAGIALAQTITKTGCDRARLKWPNDLVVGKRKLAGILCEMPDHVPRPATAIVGLGLNIASTDFPFELASTATSLFLELDRQPSCEPLAAQWIANLEAMVKNISKGARDEIIEIWRTMAEPFGRRVRVGNVEGSTVNLTTDGKLIVRRDDGENIEVAGGVMEYIA